MSKKKVLIVLADGFEETEAIAPIDTLRRADIDVRIAGLSGLEITGGHGIKVLADIKLDDIKEEFDAIVFPGGSMGAENLSKSEKVKKLIKEMHKKGKIIAAICASPAVVLAPTGILEGKNATCYPGMEKKFPPTVKHSNEEIVVDGNVVTSKGPGTALAFGIKLVELLTSKGLAESLKQKMVM